MILVIEIAFFIAGIYALITSRMPSWMVGRGYKAEGNQVRLLGIFMTVLLPGMFCGGLGIGFISGMMDSDPAVPATIFEIGSVIIAAIIVSVVLRRIRQPNVPPAQ
jgi:hypothetical protein